MDVNTFFIYLALIITGLCFGSFAGASMWRLRARQLAEDKANGEKIDHDEYESLKKLNKKSLLKDRSKCLHCSYELKWYDLIPLLSWVSLGGKCRKCRKPIGLLEPLIEIGVMAFFVLSYAFWPEMLNNGTSIAHFVIWLIAGIGLAILFAYDFKWSLIPDVVNYSLIALGTINALLVLIESSDKVSTLISIIVAAMILSGLYLALHIFSKGKWIGFGDVKLGLALSLLLADWSLAFIALFAANLVGCLIVIPAMMAKKLKRNSRIPFGPLLIVGLIIAKIFGLEIINAYVCSFI